MPPCGGVEYPNRGPGDKLLLIGGPCQARNSRIVFDYGKQVAFASQIFSAISS